MNVRSEFKRINRIFKKIGPAAPQKEGTAGHVNFAVILFKQKGSNYIGS